VHGDGGDDVPGGLRRGIDLVRVVNKDRALDRFGPEFVYAMTDHCLQGDDLAYRAVKSFSSLGARSGWQLFEQALALNQLGTLWRLRRQHDRARRHLRHSLALRERLGDRRATGLTLGALGLLAAGEGDRHGAQRLLRQAHDLFERTEDRFAMAGMRINLGVVALRSGDLLEARRLLRTLFALRAGPGLLRPAGWAEVLLAEIADRRGDESAEGHLRRASELFAQLDERMGLAHCLRSPVRAVKSLQSRGP
jgi:tetratricopeptide (TPR) repeat protein